MDLAVHLERLQIVFRKLDANTVILELVLIRLFYDGLRPFIRAQAKQIGCQKNTWDQAIKKAIMAKAKAALNLPLWICEMYACYSRGHCSALKPTKK